jgi:hypothetical protein
VEWYQGSSSHCIFEMLADANAPVTPTAISAKTILRAPFLRSTQIVYVCIGFSTIFLCNLTNIARVRRRTIKSGQIFKIGYFIGD